MDVDFIFKIAAIGIIVAVLNQILSKSGRDEYAMLTAIAGVLVVIMMVIPYVGDLFESVRRIFGF
jgi:stage III sporulation protein AC